ncbi:hypothetical protein LOZ51_002413 [Ophidiomyces ophidiicola]|nr:hypothetical protein LOZ55_000629 [Ophidiomyces ophidiicola]KAI1998679.1 hypothetical protein LOZ51_002413 [Ophidiomyces ophidiicola]
MLQELPIDALLNAFLTVLIMHSLFLERHRPPSCIYVGAAALHILILTAYIVLKLLPPGHVQIQLFLLGLAGLFYPLYEVGIPEPFAEPTDFPTDLPDGSHLPLLKTWGATTVYYSPRMFACVTLLVGLDAVGFFLQSQRLQKEFSGDHDCSTVTLKILWRDRGFYMALAVIAMICTILQFIWFEYSQSEHQLRVLLLAVGFSAWQHSFAYLPQVQGMRNKGDDQSGWFSNPNLPTCLSSMLKKAITFSSYCKQGVFPVHTKSSSTEGWELPPVSWTRDTSQLPGDGTIETRLASRFNSYDDEIDISTQLLWPWSGSTSKDRSLSPI